MKSGFVGLYSEDLSQRKFDAIEPGSPLPIHRHRNTSETVCCVRRCMAEEFYDEQEHGCIDAIELYPGGLMVVLNMLAGQWHTINALEPGSVVLECKDKPWESLCDDIPSLCR